MRPDDPTRGAGVRLDAGLMMPDDTTPGAGVRLDAGLAGVLRS